MIGHNQPSIDSVVEENLRRGLYLSQIKTITRAVRDPRLRSLHLQALAYIIEHTNSRSGMAYPGRARLAAEITYYNAEREPKRYEPASIATAISDLIGHGYIVADKRAPEGKGRALSHYATTTPSADELQAEIAAWCAKIRSQPKREFPGLKLASNVDPRINDTESADVDTGISVRPDGDADINVNDGIDVDTGIGADVDTGVGQELVERGTGREDGAASAGADSVDLDFERFWKAFPPGRKQDKGCARDLFRKFVTGKLKTRRASADTLIAAAERYAASKPNPEYTPMSSTWLNRGRWEDDVCQPDPNAARAQHDLEDAIVQMRAEDEATLCQR
jgi:hypothetical protein